MKKYLLFLSLSLILSLSFNTNAQTDETLTKKERSQVVQVITKNYSNWGKAAIDGKLKTNLLPINPSMKIYMEKGKLLILSIRAPFLGEVGRAEITPDSLLVVNRMNKAYTSVIFSQTDLFSDPKQGKELLEQIQSLILGRVVIAGKGELSSKNADKADFYPTQNGGWIIIPTEKARLKWGTYGYTLLGSGQMEAIMLDIKDGMATVAAQYTYTKSNRSDIDITASLRDRIYQAQLQLDPPQFGAKGFSRFSDFRSFHYLYPEDFIRSLKF